MFELGTDYLILRTLPPAAAACLPADRTTATTLLAVALDEEWPLPDILDLMPVHASRSASEAPLGIWVMIERRTTTVVGDIGFLGPPDGAGEMEMGYSVVPSRRRRGYATEAARALVAWALEQPGVTAILAGTDADNVGSQRVLERAGFERTMSTPTEVRWRRERAGSSS
ncbi:MAG: GNAT family N-acetyltransferase [Chloroflexota bacterium]